MNMHDIELKVNDEGRGAFVIERDNKRIAEMVIAIRDGNLTVFHTEVDPSLKGEGIGSKLLTTMVDYARKQKLKVIPLCPFVHAQFKRHPNEYADVWNQSWHRKPHST